MSDEQLNSCTRKNSFNNDEIPLSILNLPVEIILHICSFLDAATLVYGLSLVCKQFHNILNDDSFWKMRINQIWPDVNYPAFPPAQEDELFWKLSCISIERQALLWKKEGAMEKITLNNVHFGTIDGLLLMDIHGTSVCISGARDRALVFWNLSNEENKCQKSVSVDHAHEGWIWDLTAINDTVYSCSWDQTVKSWALKNTGLTHLTTYEMSITGALLCVTSCPDSALFATGSFHKTVLVYDSRADDKPVTMYKPHQRAVIRLAMSSNFILSASEDRTVAVWDQRAGRIRKTITVSKEAFPMSMCMRNNLVYIGDSSGMLHILDEKENFEPVKSYTTEHDKGITGVYFDPGCLITSSLDKTVRISSPTDPPRLLTTLGSSYGVIASIDYLNEVLAISGTDTIDIWRPKFTQNCL